MNIVNFISELKGCKIIGMTTETEPKILKRKGKEIGITKVIKVETGNYLFNFNYEKAVNKRRTSEGNNDTFEAKGLSWGEWLSYNKVISHKDTFYIRYYKNMKLNNRINTTYYNQDNQIISKETAYSIMPTKKAGTSQGLIDNIDVRCVKVENIKRLKVDGKEFTR